MSQHDARELQWHNVIRHVNLPIFLFSHTFSYGRGPLNTIDVCGPSQCELSFIADPCCASAAQCLRPRYPLAPPRACPRLPAQKVCRSLRQQLQTQVSCPSSAPVSQPGSQGTAQVTAAPLLVKAPRQGTRLAMQLAPVGKTSGVLQPHPMLAPLAVSHHTPRLRSLQYSAAVPCAPGQAGLSRTQAAGVVWRLRPPWQHLHRRFEMDPSPMRQRRAPLSARPHTRAWQHPLYRARRSLQPPRTASRHVYRASSHAARQGHHHQKRHLVCLVDATTRLPVERLGLQTGWLSPPPWRQSQRARCWDACAALLLLTEHAHPLSCRRRRPELHHQQQLHHPHRLQASSCRMLATGNQVSPGQQKQA
jgi:hypothetical protein